MAFDAFSAGVEIGGLRSKNDIKILICYLLKSISTPLSEEDIVSVLQENNLANYFEVVSAFEDLKNMNNIYSYDKNELYSETGKLIAEQLISSVPISVREKTLNTAINLLSKRQLEKENTVEITPLENGYSVKCTVVGDVNNSNELLSFMLYVPDLLQANQVKENFQKRPDLIYRIILAGVTMDNDLIKDIFNEI